MGRRRWDESRHPRDDHGRFSRTPGSRWAERVSQLLPAGPATRPASPHAGAIARLEAAATGRDALYAVDRPPPSAARGVSAYYGDGYREINNALRGRDPGNGRRVSAAVSSLDAGFRATRTDRDVVAHRGVFYGSFVFGHQAWAAPSLEGMEFEDRGYSSTTTNPAVVSRFTSQYTDEGVSMRILVPQGTPALRLSEWGDEAELLLNRGSRFRVIRDHGTQDGIRNIDVEVVGG